MASAAFGAMTPAEQDAFLSQPALAPPLDVPGAPTSSHSGLGLSVTIACTVIAWVVLPVRLYAYVVYRKETRVQEWLALVAVAAFTALLYPGYQLAKIDAFFVHQWDMDRRQYSEVLLLTYIMTTAWYLTMLFAKSAILLEWLRVFWPGHARNAVWWLCNVALGLLAAYFAAGFLFFQARCRPFSQNWEPWAGGRCADRSVIDHVSAYFNIVLDCLIFVLPQVMIWNLNASVKRRVGKSCIFSFALLGIACDCGRAQNIHSFDYGGDVAYSLSSTYLWSLAECTVVILVYCALPISRIYTEPKVPPFLVPAHRWYRRRFGGRNTATKTAAGESKSRQWARAMPGSLSPVPNNVYERMDDGTNSEIHLTHLPPQR